MTTLSGPEGVPWVVLVEVSHNKKVHTMVRCGSQMTQGTLARNVPRFNESTLLFVVNCEPGTSKAEHWTLPGDLSDPVEALH